MNILNKMNQVYIPLHVHYEKGSIGDSILKTKDAVKKAKDLGIPALSITDHGSMANVIDFYKECNDNGIKPLIGLEAYECDDRTAKEKGYYHLVLLAKNKQGYEDLLHISADSQFNGYYYKPRTDMSVLKEYGSNIIALSACLGGRIPRMINDLIKLTDTNSEDVEAVEENLNNIKAMLEAFNIDAINNLSNEQIIEMFIDEQYKNIIKTIEEYKSCFADFYLELQPGNFEEQITINKLLVDLAMETDTKLIITNDVHYLNAEDYVMHDQHVKMAQKKKHDDPMVYPDKSYYLMGYEEIKTMFPYLEESVVEEALNNTVRVMQSIDLSNLYDGKIKMPKADIPEGYSEDEYLAKICMERLNAISYRLKDPSEYYDRAMYELDTLREVGFSGYLLIIKDIYDYAAINNIPMGPGRGSIGGSLCAYLIGITKVDPIKYGLLFERFISIHRKGSVPDVDLDVGADYRHLLFEYTVNKYGEDCCALVSTFTIRKARSAIKDTARIFGIDTDFANLTAKLIPQVYYNDEDGEKQTDLSIAEALEISKELREIKAKHEDWFEAAIKLEDLSKTTSIHAAGTLISPIPLKKYVPLIRNKNDGMMATALALGDAEYAGAIKYDYLSLATLNITSATEKDTGFIADFDNDEWLSNPYVWDLIGSQYTTTLFQIASDTYKKRMGRLKPRTIEELAACLALVRGPCIASKMDEVYMEIVEGKREIELIHPFYDSVTASTNGVLLYQEQMMQILVNFGMDLERAFQVMKYAAKKKQDLLAAAEEEYRELANKNNIPEDVATRIWNIMLDTGKYSFNKSHAVAYALLCYYSAFLKVYFPMEWMKNALTNAYTRKENIPETIQECRRLGIRFLGLDINKSKWEFSIENNQLRVGFVAAKGLGHVAYEALNDARPFNSLQEVIDKVTNKFNKKAFTVSIFAGAMDEWYSNRAEAFDEYCTIKEHKPVEEIKISKDMVFKVDDSLQDIETVIFEVPITSNPVQYFEPFDFYSLRERQTCNVQAVVRRVSKKKDKNGNMMAFLTLETYCGYIEATVFSAAYKGNTKHMKKNNVISLMGKKNKDGLIIEKFVA